MIEIKKISSKGLSYEYSAKISKDEVIKATEDCIKKFATNIKVSGFRNGHAPLEIVSEQYGKSLLPYVINILIDNSCNKISNDDNHTIAIVSEPNLSPEISLTDLIKNGFSTLLSFDVHPKIDELKLNKVTVDYKTASISQEMIDEELNYMAKMFASKEEVSDTNYITKDGDVADIAFTGYFADTKKEVPNAKSENYPLELGSKSFIPGFEEQVVGHKIGEEFTISVTFPEDYGSKDLAGKDVNFDIKINKISSTTNASIDDALAKKFNFENLEALTDNIKGRIKKSIDKILQNYILNSVCDKLGEDISVSEKLMEREFNNIKANNKEDLPSDDELRVIIKRQMARNYILVAIAKQLQIEVSKEDLDEAMANEAFRIGKSTDEVKEEYTKNKQKFNELYFSVQESKVFEKLITIINNKTTAISYEQFIEYIKDINSKKQKIIVKN